MDQSADDIEKEAFAQQAQIPLGYQEVREGTLFEKC